MGGSFVELQRVVFGDQIAAHRHDTTMPQSRPAGPSSNRGFTIFFTGLSGAGKSTIAQSLRDKLVNRTGRHVTLLDGDVVRQQLTSELGYSRADRDRNVLRVGFVAAEITKHQGIVICALIAPFDDVRRAVKRMVEEGGGFILVHLETPLEVCESRDVKGLYAKARAGLLPQFTGVTDPYEVPTNAELVIDTGSCTAESATRTIIDYLEESGYLAKTNSDPR
jgi:sulfate adenylyltransferase